MARSHLIEAGLKEWGQKFGYRKLEENIRPPARPRWRQVPAERRQ